MFTFFFNSTWLSSNLPDSQFGTVTYSQKSSLFIMYPFLHILHVPSGLPAVLCVYARHPSSPVLFDLTYTHSSHTIPPSYL